MAEFIIGNPLRKIARKYGPVRKILWALDFAVIWLLLSVYRLLPVDAASRLGERIGAWIGPRLTRKTKLFHDNLAIALPQLDDRERDELVRSAWGRAGRILAEYPHLSIFASQPERLEINILEHIETFGNPERPCIVVTAHLSNWEVVGSALAKLNVPNAALYSPPVNPRLDRLLLASRAALNCELLPRDNSARALMLALKNGRSVAMVMDRRVEGGHPIPFFGHEKESTLMPAKLAQKFNCDLVPAQVERMVDARYRVTFHPPVRAAQPGDNETAQAVDMTRQVHAHFERWILQQPQDWFCSKRLWAKGTLNSKEEAGIAVDINSHAA